VTSPAPSTSLRAAFLAPRSFALLALALVLAAAFAGLGQWQIARAIEQGTVVARPTERTVPLTSVAEPAHQQTDASVGQKVATRGRLVPADTVIVGDRLNDDATMFLVEYRVESATSTDSTHAAHDVTRHL